MKNFENISKLSISGIKTFVEETGPDDSLIEILSNDPRAGVRALAKKLERLIHRNELLRLKQEEMSAIENNLRAEGKKIIAGIDEAGRGPLAGPVVAASVILPEDVSFEGLDDSKKMTAARREDMFERITSLATAWGIGMIDNEEIDNIGILNAAMKAMRIAVNNMKMNPDIAIVDGNRSPDLECEERLIVNGDGRCRSIAAASVIAKVSRDRIMVVMDEIFPGYGFARHKGYGSHTHVKAISELGPCDIHRFSFKLVPKTAPPGTVAAVLKKRLLNAYNRQAFDRAAAGIARIRENLYESDIEALRDVYRKCSQKMKDDRRNTGIKGEVTGCNYLVNKGYKILDRNWRADRSNYEIDIVAQINHIIVFCEVKTAGTHKFGPSISWVTPEKIERISRAAQEYITTHNTEGYSFRFDVIGNQVEGDKYDIIHIENAFTAPEEL
ncbi:MAG: ribonuclease HII [Candidatus Latescibacteria bacterium]|jgi:ribonuclease HII|nr:ribonuclease HII [Candidatus Latescibacterota bacterium]